MSTKKGRGAKVPPYESQKGPPLNDMDSPNLSAVDVASFLEGLQLKYGNLHSTALDEDLNVSEEGQMNKGKAGRKDNPQTSKNTVKQHGAAKKRKETEKEKEEEEVKKKRRRKSTGGMVKTRPEKDEETKKKNGAPPGERGRLDGERKESEPSAILQEGNQPTPTVSRPKGLVGKKPAKRRSVGQTSAARPVENQKRRKGKKEESESGNGNFSDPLSQEEADTGTTQHRRKYVLSSDEEMVDEDMSWNPSPKKAKVYSLGKIRKSSSDRSKSRKSSSGSASAGAEKANPNEQRTKKHGGHGRTELEVVLDAFLDFCEQYRETVESEAVKQSIDCFSSNVKQQLLEKINSYKEFRCLKRENAKVGSLIRKKTQRLLDAKYELMRAERQARLLQKEKDELQLRLADLRRGQAFLHDIRELNRQYLDYRRKHPREKETYGAASLPALLLETKRIQSAEHQLRGINSQLEKIVKNRELK